MTPLTFECPRTCGTIDTGIHTDANALAAAGRATLKLYCPHCRSTHELPLHCGRLSKSTDETEPPKAPALTIAVNALRISWLKRGLGSRQA